MKSIKDNPKKTRGRPATGKAPLVGVRMPEEFQAEIKAWAKKQPDHPALAPAIRRLVELGLSKSVSQRQPKVARAWQLATMSLDELIDPKAPPEERKVRKRKLVEGPSVFRDARKDRPGR
jgi:hypothetical protein